MADASSPIHYFQPVYDSKSRQLLRNAIEILLSRTTDYADSLNFHCLKWKIDDQKFSYQVVVNPEDHLQFRRIIRLQIQQNSTPSPLDPRVDVVSYTFKTLVERERVVHEVTMRESDIDEMKFESLSAIETVMRSLIERWSEEISSEMNEYDLPD
jgi:hypothetical protein